jgi:cellulose synthase operon protein C
MKFFDAKWKRWTFASVLTVGLLVGGAVGGKRYLWPKIKSWRIERMNGEAREFLAKGDANNALLTARKTLQTSQENVEAWRIAVAAAKTRQTNEVLYYQQNLARLDPTKENYLELIRLCIRYNAFGPAMEAIKNVAKNANDDPEFHSLASQVYLRAGRKVAAKFHLLALTQLKPTDRAAQLDLAELQMADDPGRKDTGLRARVLLLADEPALRKRALTLLLRESISAKLRVETGELVGRLQAVPELGIAERLLLLEGATMTEGPLSPTILQQLQTEVSKEPIDVVRVMDFLARSGQGRQAVAWFPSLPEETRKDENVRRTVAEILLTLRDWRALEAHLKSGTWPTLEFVRQALLAYTYRAQQRPSDFAEAWKATLLAIGSDPIKDPQKAGYLLSRVEGWKWVTERYDVVWKLFTLVPTNAQFREALMTWERRQGNTANLNKIFARHVEVEPTSALARNNLAYSSLLLDSNIARMGVIAAELAASFPDNPYFVTTHAFALFKQGNAAEALKRLEALSATELSAPERMLLRAVFLARTGETARAAELMKGIKLQPLLPEEQRLGEGVFLEIARRERTQGDKNRLVELQQKQGTDAGGAGWLALLTPEARAAATVEMQLTEPLYASGNWAGLQTALRTVDWKNDNYLRLALQAYASRMRGDSLQSRDTWKQALASADRNPVRVQNLQNLTIQWNWNQERFETINSMFERAPTDRNLVAELLKHHRETKRTGEMVRVLTAHVGRTSDNTAEAVALAYYSLLTDANLSRAHVLAEKTFTAAPDDVSRRLAYAFSLLKQRRAAEAQTLLAEIKAGESSDLAPVSLVRAAVQAELGAFEEARASLALFDSTTALPEEAALAARIALQLSREAEKSTK